MKTFVFVQRNYGVYLVLRQCSSRCEMRLGAYRTFNAAERAAEAYGDYNPLFNTI